MEQIFSNATIEVIQIINFIAVLFIVVGLHIVIRKEKSRTWNVLPILVWAYLLSGFYALRLLSLHGYFESPYPLFFTTISSIIRFQLTLSLAVEVAYLLYKYHKQGKE